MAAKDLYEKDLYAVLGVKKSDNADAIKKQYRKLARELHPDKTKGDKKLEERFKDVSEAYEVLSDDKKKAEYDEMRDAYKSGRVPRGGFQQQGGFGGGFPGGFQGGGDFSDIFGDLFGGVGRRGPRKGQDLQTQTTISFRDSVYGSEITIRTGTEPFTTRLPAGIKDGAKIKLKGRGAPGEGGPGDLFIVVNVTPHPLYKRDENNLLMTLPVTFTEAALGADIAVPTLSGEEVKVRLSAGTPNGKKLKLKGHGIRRNHEHGDLILTIEVQVPQRLDSKAEKLLKEFAEETKEFSPRTDLKQKSQA
jgi:molecular chaperone DnaJ